MTEDQMRQAILASPFAEHVEALMAGGQPGLRLHAEKVALDDLAPGASRLGGLPDLPPGRSWPYDGNDRPLEMVAQINLAEVAGHSYLPDLPASGWLAFFFEGTLLTWHVAYFDCAAGDLVRLATPPGLARNRGFIGRLLSGPPKPSHYYQPCAVRFERDFRLVFGEENPDLGNINKPYSDAYGDMWESIGHWSDDVQHRLRGHEDPVQGPMRREVEEMARRAWLIEPTDLDPEESKWDWQLLLQISSDQRDPGWMWSDNGRLYYWIRRQDLAARDFSKVRCIMQSH
jgi:uncharacterized protein YwqG